MNKQATFLAFLIGIVTVLSINAKVDRTQNSDPIYYNSFFSAPIYMACMPGPGQMLRGIYLLSAG